MPKWVAPFEVQGQDMLRPYTVCGPVIASRRSFLKTSASMAALASVRVRLPLLGGRDSKNQEAFRARLAADPLRPQFHLLPAKNWMNDPNGPIYWKGHYHMFFQYNPNAAVWGDMHWNHAISEDMIHWRHLPIALAPTPGWDDADGCFTGSAVDDHGTATIFYTGVKTVAPERATLPDGVQNFREVQCLATSSDPQLRTWNKWKAPVIEPPQDPRLMGFRDPFLWRESPVAERGRTLRSSASGSAAPLKNRGDAPDWWYLGVASGIRHEGGNVRLYRSKDLRQWEYLHLLASGKWTEKESVNPVDSGEMWECPDFFPLGKKHVLLYSTAGGVYWETGELDPEELAFHSQKRGILDHGAYYAQKTQLDAHGNRILWGWITEKRSDDELRAAGWAGCMALPRVLSIGSDGGLEMRFAPAVQSLRGENIVVAPEQAGVPAKGIEISNLAGEFAWETTPGVAATFSLADRGGKWYSVALENGKDSRSTVTVNGQSVELPESARSVREFHLFLDGSVAELLCDRKYAITSRIYRTPDGPLSLAGADSDYKEITPLGVWQMRAISANRLTI